MSVAARHAVHWAVLDASSARHSTAWGFAPYGARHSARWAVLSASAGRHRGVWAGRSTVSARHAVEHGGTAVVAARHTTHFAGKSVVSTRHSCGYAGLAIVSSRHATNYGGRGRVFARHAATYASRSVVTARHGTTHKLTDPVSARHTIWHMLLDSNPVDARHSTMWAGPDAEIVTVTGETYLLHQERRMELGEDTTLSADEGSPVWIATLDIIDEADFSRVSIGDLMTLVMWGNDVALVCDSRRTSRGDDVSRYIISAISPVALSGDPWAIPVTLGETTGMAHATAESLLGPIDWALPDWQLPAAALEASPLEIARQIAAAPGGVIESAPDGSLTARHLYPIPVPDYDSQSLPPLTDRDLLGQSDSASISALENRFVVTSGDDASATDHIQIETEQDPDDPHAYTVRAYPFPFRDVTLAHTGDGATQIGAREEVTIQHEQLVEILAGSATTSHPVDTIISEEYQYADLGTVRTDGTAITAATADYSQLAILYRARAWQWRVTNARSETIQFLAVE